MTVGRSRLSRGLALLASVLAGWLLLSLLVLLEIVPGVPRGARGWVLLLVVGTPVYVAAGWVSDRLFSPEAGTRVSKARFSFARIAVATVVLLIVYVPLVWWWSLRRAG